MAPRTVLGSAYAAWLAGSNLSPAGRDGPGALRLGLAFATVAVVPALALSHTRWFTTVANDVTPPLPPTRLFASPEFLTLFLVTWAIAVGVQGVDAALRERRHVFSALLEHTDRRMTDFAPTLVRWAMAFYFASIAGVFGAAPITLAPELKASASWLLPVQLLIALGLVLPRGVIPSCVAIVLLYAYSAGLHGWVHMVDYHLFLGICAYMVLHAVSRQLGATTGLLLLRLLVATSFLWVGIEKWLYPQWTEDVLLHQLPMLLMGMDPAFVVMAAGFVEVALAFLVLFGGVSSQVAAAVLMGLMLAAIPVAGMVDGVGHMPMVVGLFILATTRSRIADCLPQVSAPVGTTLSGTYFIAVPGLVGLYYLVHEFVAASGRNGTGLNVSLSLLWCLVLVCWTARTVIGISVPARAHGTRTVYAMR
jgi:uncharacterized membrane protein YphA (DoxX/SURF4 family)